MINFSHLVTLMIRMKDGHSLRLGDRKIHLIYHLFIHSCLKRLGLKLNIILDTRQTEHLQTDYQQTEHYGNVLTCAP